MFGHLLDQFRNNNDQDINPWLTAAATYLGSELLEHHGHDDNNEDDNNEHRSHFWRNAALSGALAYGLNKYQEHQQQQRQQQQEQSYYPQQLTNENYYYSSPPYVPYSQPLYYQQPYYQNPVHYSSYYMNAGMPMAMNPYLRQQQVYPYPPSFMLPYQYQQTPYSPYYYGIRTPPLMSSRYYSSFSPYSHQRHMVPYQQALPYRYMY